jgi:3-deoxy-7-phosphoheptulonate synthase
MKIVASLPNPEELKKEIGPSEEASKRKEAANSEIAAILRGESPKLLLIAGPCSADDPAAVLEYAGRLSRIAEVVRERVCIVLRVFTAKPRSACSGYMGLIHEEGGIPAARRLHLEVFKQTGLPAADELLYPAALPYFDDIVSYFAVGARSSENQEHRLVASGMTVPVGMKNPLSGDLQSLANAVAAAKAPHNFIFGGNRVQSLGNPLAHGILRGGATPNYGAQNLIELHKMGLSAVIVDVNHGNSGKDYTKQPEIAMKVLENRSLIKGLMIESYIVEGAESRGKQAFGQSITDPCLGLAATEKLIYEIAEKV